MKSFTGIIFWSILLICSACTDENETNNGKRTDCYNGTPLTVRATATGFENIPGSEKPSTRASVTDEHLKTEFVDGDSIGIFSIKDGTIVDDINNIPLVYNVSNDSWNPVENSKTLYWYDGASYIAYYPYRKNITLDVSKDTDEAIASLTRNEKLQPSKDQSTKEKHTVSHMPLTRHSRFSKHPNHCNPELPSEAEPVLSERQYSDFCPKCRCSPRQTQQHIQARL